MIVAWLSAFLVTQAIECPIYARALNTRSHRWRWAFGASAITHPIVFFLFPTMGFDGYWITVSWAEAFAVGVEAAYLTALSVRFSVIWALAANMASVGVGLLLRYSIGWP